MAYDDLETVELFDEYENKLSKAFSALAGEYKNLKAGRANPHLLDKITVDYYGTPTPINQLGNISIPEARILVVSVWDQSALKSVEKAIIAANIGLTPNNDGKVIRLIFPELNEERRKELVKSVKSMAENTKVVMRNARRDINDILKKKKKDSAITEDDLSTYEKDVDKKLSESIETVDAEAKAKEKDIMSV